MTQHQPVGHHWPVHPPHRMQPRRTRRAGLVAGLALALNIAVAGSAAAQDGTATPAPATPEPDAPRIVIEFEELNDSGVTGEATLYEFDDQTIVELEMENTGENHPAHIHEGTCEDINPEPAYPLENVGEEGTSRTTVDAPLQDLIDGDYVIDLHLAPNQLGTLINCAEIEGTPEVPGVGGEGTPTAEATEEATAEATEEATAEPTATPTEEPTTPPTPEPTAEPTAKPTEAPTEATDGTGGLVPTTTPTDGTGADSTTSGVSDPTRSGKGQPVGGSTTNGDGTSGQTSALSGKGEPVGGATDGLPQTTGSGSSLLTPGTQLGVAIQAMTAFSAVLLLAAIAIRRGETRRAHAGTPTRFRRLGL